MLEGSLGVTGAVLFMLLVNYMSNTVRLAFISADHAHFINEKTEGQRGYTACPRLLS